VSEPAVVRDDSAQEGIYFRAKESPPGFFALLLLNVVAGKSASDVDRLLQELWKMYGGLKKGKVHDLGDADVNSGNLAVLLGFGRQAFEIDDHARSLRPALLEQVRFASPADGGSIAVPDNSLRDTGLRNAGIAYASDANENPADAAFAFQFTAETPLAVERAVVETWKVLHDHGAGAALEFAAVYTGSKRDDERSWIDFKDGTSNMKSEERGKVILIAPDDGKEWTRDGSYMAFMRLRIDLEVWRGRSTKEQEKLVGRTKIKGCPLAAVDRLEPDCPREPTGTDDSVLKYSHVQRANRHLGSPAERKSLRIYRQGYPFFEASSVAPGFRAGLNFVSFQESPWRLFRLLMDTDWLGTSNFGGLNGSMPTPLLTAYAVGMFLVPPRSTDAASYPGRQVFNPALA
jgi:deferrochelatase/peroxidase EfeB